MTAIVEPRDGPELDRLITALLNATGVVHRIIEDGRHEPGLGGAEIIDRCAGRLRSMLAVFAEHHDDTLAFITGFLAVTSLLVAEEAGFEDVFYEA